MLKKVEMSGIPFLNSTKYFEMAEISQRVLISFISNYRSGKTVCIFSLSISVAFMILVLFVSFMYFNQPLYENYEYKETKDDEINKRHFEVKPYVQQYAPVEVKRIYHNFLPDTQDLEPSEDYGIERGSHVVFRRIKNEGTEQEALTAVQMALKMKNVNKIEKAKKLFQHAMALQPLHPDVLIHYGEFLEEKNEVIEADHLYKRALTVSPDHSRALCNRKRTMPVVNELDEKELERIEKKRISLIKLNHKDPALKRVKKEIYFQHIHHTVAIEGNTMTLAETRMVVETRMAVHGKSVLEHNEILGLESALRYINKTLVNKDGLITVLDILAIHKRVLGYADPLEAGTFRQSQVFVGEHTPPQASDVPDLMEEFVEWLQSDYVQRLHPIKQAALAHYKMVYIHPFIDGNGRTARLLMNLILMRAGYPPVIIQKQHRYIYYSYLQLANEGDIRPFFRFIARCTECTLDVFLYAKEYGTTCFKALESNKPEHTDIIPL